MRGRKKEKLRGEKETKQEFGRQKQRRRLEEKEGDLEAKELSMVPLIMGEMSSECDVWPTCLCAYEQVCVCVCVCVCVFVILLAMHNKPAFEAW